MRRDYIFCHVVLTSSIWSIVNTDKYNDEFSEIGSFKNYIDRYEPSAVWNKIIKEQKERKYNYTTREYIDKFIAGVDSTEDMLKLKVQNGDAKILIRKDGRRWKAPVGLQDYHLDKFSLKPRFFELMKQSIYQARNKMVIMQILRQKYRDHKLYKMGFMMSKTDQAVRTFAKFAFRSIRACGLVRADLIHYMRIIDIMLLQERLINIWFNVQLLTDLIIQNDEEFHDTMKDHNVDRLKHWKFVE